MAETPGSKNKNDRHSQIWLGHVILALFLGLLGPGQSLAQDEQLFRLVTFSSGTDLRLGATRGSGSQDILDVHNAIAYLIKNQPSMARDLPYIPADMKALIEAGDRSIQAVRKVYENVSRLRERGNFSEPGSDRRVFHPPTSVRLRAPVQNPSKIFGMAGNYPREGATPEYPSAFLKATTALVGPDDVIDLKGIVPGGVHEPELALIIGKTARNVSEADAFDYVVGYTIVNDVTASRELPMGNHPTQGGAIRKSIDTFSPSGPYLTLKEDIPDPHNLDIAARLNGENIDIPTANTRYMLFKIPQVISYLSHRITLLPGDIIATGVPRAVVLLRAGDRAEMVIEKLGVLRNRVVEKQ